MELRPLTGKRVFFKHVESGRYVRDPVHLPVRGFGPREVVFPIRITEQLDRITLLGDWRRYQRSAGLDEIEPIPSGQRDGERLVLRVDRLDFAIPPPLLTSWGTVELGRTLCLDGVAANTELVGRRVVVPLRELFWRELRGYRERYLAR